MSWTAVGRWRNRDDDGMALPAPLRTPSHLNLAWLQQILTNWLRQPVTAACFTLEVQDDSNGFLSEILFVGVRYEAKKDGSGQGEKDCRLAIKLLPGDSMKRQFVLDHKVALREIGAYRFFSSHAVAVLCSQHDLHLPVPEVIYAEPSLDAITIVLEDLREDYEVACPKKGLGLERVKAMLKAIAVVHALGRVCIMKNGVETILQHLPAVSCGGNFLDSYVRSGLAHLASLSLTETMKKLLTDLIPVAHRFGVVLTETQTVPDTLLHGDYWAGQVMVGRHDQKKIKILDWQFAGLGNPFVDVVTLLVMSAAPDVLSHHLKEVVESYWGSYTATLASCRVPLSDVQMEKVETATQGVEAAIATVETLWHIGLRMLLASVKTHLAQRKITKDRVARVLNFFNTKGVLAFVLDDMSEKC